MWRRVLLVCMVSCFASGCDFGASAKVESESNSEIERYVVQCGDTLWSIARSHRLTVKDVLLLSSYLEEEYVHTCAGIRRTKGYFCNDSRPDAWMHSLRPGEEIDLPLWLARSPE